MVGLTLLLDLWKKNQSFNTARTFQSSSFFSSSATVASFAAASSFSSNDFFGYDLSLLSLYTISSSLISTFYLMHIMILQFIIF